ncbi:amidohydrolase family protein [Leifsonia sp. NPDC058248]|uniref:amidohydrolase family protein n=1 Tax=Leifsonia sp. NPDC058248 TaxID=3346402 RepID=UPI0036DF330A
MTVDAHLHLWDLDRVEYPWLTAALGPIHRTFALTEVAPQLERAGVDRVVLVQAANSLEDSEAMFAVAADSPLVAGVVAWVDLLDPRAAAAQLDRWVGHPVFAGVRHLIHDEPDPDWLARDAVRESLALLASRDLTFDVVGVLPRHLEHALAIAAELPGLRLVIDHLGTPPVGAADPEPWRGLMTRLGEHPNVFVKLSGLTTLGPAGRADAASLRPFVDHVLAAFGAERVLYGGDWPVSTLAGPYAETWETTHDLVSQLSAGESLNVFEGAADRAYHLG